MKMVKFIILVCITIMVSNIKAQDGQTYNKQFGMHLGSTTGAGFAYRQWINNFGFELAGIYGEDEDEFGSAGLTLMYTIQKSNYIRFYWYLGNCIYYSNDNYSNQSETFYNFGSGPGLSFGKVVQFNLMFGYGVYNVTDEFNIYPAGEIGLSYCF